MTKILFTFCLKYDSVGEILIIVLIIKPIYMEKFKKAEQTKSGLFGLWEQGGLSKSGGYAMLIARKDGSKPMSIFSKNEKNGKHALVVVQKGYFVVEVFFEKSDCDVDVFHCGWDGVEHLFEYLFVAEYHGCFELFVFGDVAQKVIEVACLYVLCSSRYECDVLLFAQIVVGFICETVGKAAEVRTHEAARIVVGVVGVDGVVVPIEEGFPLLLQKVEERLFAAVEGIEAGEDVFFLREFEAVTILYYIAAE